MKKIIAILFIVSALYANNFAQDKYLSISGGYTNTLGVFAQSDFNDQESGYAKNGYNFSFESMFFFNDFWGLGANLRFNNAGFDSDVFNKYLKDNFLNSELDSINLISGNYTLHNFLFGPYVKTNIGGYLSLYAKVFIGVMSSYRPNQTLVYKRPYENVQTLETVGQYTGSFAYNFGVGALIKFSSRLGINLSADYIAGKPKFDSFDFQLLEVIERKQPIAYLNYNAGLLVTF